MPSELTKIKEIFFISIIKTLYLSSFSKHITIKHNIENKDSRFITSKMIQSQVAMQNQDLSKRLVEMILFDNSKMT